MIPVQTNTYRFMAEYKNILGRILCIPSCSFVSLLRPRQKNVAITCINYYVNFYHIHCTQMIDGVGGKPSRDPVYHLPVDGIPLTTAFRDLWFHLPTAHRYSCIAKRKSCYDYCYIFRAIPIVTMDFTYDRTENVLLYVHSIVNMGMARRM